MRSYKLEVHVRWLVLAAFIWACSSGCTMLQKSPQKAEQARESKKVTAVTALNSNPDLPFFHQVRWQGETLSMIAKWYTGDWRNWKALAEVNPWLEPDNMFTGLKVKIPRQLLKNQKDMPREFVLSFASQNKASVQTKEANEKEVSESSPGRGEAKGANIQFVGP